MIFLREECSNSASLMTTLLAFSRKRHKPLVQLPAAQTKVVTMGAPLNKYGLEMFSSLIFWKFRSGLSALQSWMSVESSSVSAENKASPNNSSEFGIAEAECDLWCMLGSFSGINDVSLFWDLEQENSLRGEREGRVGEKGISWDLGGEVCFRGGWSWFGGFSFSFSFSREHCGAVRCGEGGFAKFFLGFFFCFLIVYFSVFFVWGWAGYTIFLLVLLYSLFFILSLLRFPSPQAVPSRWSFFSFLFGIFVGWWRLSGCGVNCYFRGCNSFLCCLFCCCCGYSFFCLFCSWRCNWRTRLLFSSNQSLSFFLVDWRDLRF